MGRKAFYFFIFLLPVLAVLTGCTKDKVNDVVYKYSGSGGRGDIMTFQVNQTSGGYSVHNETHSAYDNGSFTVYSNEMKGLYKIFAYGAFYYGVEYAGKVFTGNFPTGYLGNRLAYGVTENSNSAGPGLAGDYVFVCFSDHSVNGSTANRSWGILSISNDGTWMKQSYCNDTGAIPRLFPEEYTGPLPLVSASDSGTWMASYYQPERLVMSKLHSSDTITGFLCSSDSGAVFVMDLGLGKGFLVGCKIVAGGQNKLEGNFGFADYYNNGATGGGKYYYNDSTRMITWYRADSYAKVKNGVFGVLTQCDVLKNVYYIKNTVFNGDNVDIYLFVSGPYLVELQWMNNRFRSYGTGARLP